ncbi:hypothetical protein LTSEMIS_4644 [Salmonella enterica subsp. enterica serovar Mississippi str. A4-633]|nr:hypothetical protein LTSEMIS_4644 [Salmonella enterica subsp. enterica serovar Mississippi str. A4-633]
MVSNISGLHKKTAAITSGVHKKTAAITSYYKRRLSVFIF